MNKEIISNVDSIVDVTTDREAFPESDINVRNEHWYVAIVRTCCERQAEKAINALGITAWVPVQQVIRLWSDRKKKVEVVVIPSMVFFRISGETDHEVHSSILKVNKVSYVYRILSMPGSNCPAVIPDNQIKRMKFMLNYADSPVSFEEGRRLKEGDPVRVCRGQLKGFEGCVYRAPDGATKIFIAIDYLGCAVMEISPNDIELLERR